MRNPHPRECPHMHRLDDTLYRRRTVSRRIHPLDTRGPKWRRYLDIPSRRQLHCQLLRKRTIEFCGRLVREEGLLDCASICEGDGDSVTFSAESEGGDLPVVGRDGAIFWAEEGVDGGLYGRVVGGVYDDLGGDLPGTAGEGSGYCGSGVLAEGKDARGWLSSVFIAMAEEAVVAREC